NIFIPALAGANFVNAAIDDYHLTALSPSINTGKDNSSYNYNTDYDNIGRPFAATWDVGSYEFGTNMAPIVTVGANQNISLPTSSTTVSGAATDADGTIASYLWTKQSGPTVTITNQTTTTVSLANLITGVYT